MAGGGGCVIALLQVACRQFACRSINFATTLGEVLLWTN